MSCFVKITQNCCVPYVCRNYILLSFVAERHMFSEVLCIPGCLEIKIISIAMIILIMPDWVNPQCHIGWDDMYLQIMLHIITAIYGSI